MSKAVTKRALADSLKSLMRERAFTKISVEDICKKANISRRNFYRYFPDKYELLNWIGYEDYFSKIKLHKDYVIWDYFPEICQLCYDDKEFFRNALTIEGQNSMRSYTLELIRPLIVRDFKDELLAGQNENFYISRTTDALFDYVREWLRSEPCMPPDKFAYIVRRSVASHAKRIWEIASRNMPEAPESVRQDERTV